MKRARYVGRQESFPWSHPDRHPLIYGMTGEFREYDTFSSFRPDGCEHGKMIPRSDVYILPEDTTRYCPKP